MSNSQKCVSALCVCVYVCGHTGRRTPPQLFKTESLFIFPQQVYITPLLSLFSFIITLRDAVHLAVPPSLWQNCVSIPRSRAAPYLATVNLFPLPGCSSMAVFISIQEKAQAVNLRLLFTGGYSQPHGHGQVVGNAGQLSDETVLLDVLRQEESGAVIKCL